MNKLKYNIFQNVIIFFDSINIDVLIEELKINLSGIYAPLYIIISENAKEFKINGLDQRTITNIIYKNMNDEELKNKIISILWEYDCYYNERGNEICKCMPNNFFKSSWNESIFLYY